MKRSRPVQFAAFVLLITAYVAFRFWHLTDSCLWFDEIFSVHAAEHAWDSLFSFVALDLIHPPLFYVLLKLWIGAGGEGLFWLRLFPVISAVVSLVPFILFLREVKQNRWVKIFALFLLTVNGSLIKYSQEVRMYSLLLCFSLFSMWLFARYFVKGKSFIPLVVVNLLLVYTHYFGWFVILSEIAGILIFQRIKWWRILVMFAVEFVCFTPWIYAVWNAAHSGSELGQNISWMTRPGPREVITFILNLVEPFYYQASNADPVSMLKISVPLLLIAVVTSCLYFATWKHQSADEVQTVKLLALFSALPAISAFGMSWLLPYSIWGTRHLIIVVAPAMILISMALMDIKPVALQTGLTTLALLLCGYGSWFWAIRPTSTYSWSAWEELVSEIPVDDSHDILVFEDLVAYHVWFATRGRSDPPRIIKINGLKGTVEDNAYFLPRGFGGVSNSDLYNLENTKFWLLYRDFNPDGSGSPESELKGRGFKLSIKGARGSKFENEFLSIANK